MKFIKILIMTLVLGCMFILATGCSMEKCGEDMTKATATPGQTTAPTVKPQITPAPQETTQPQVTTAPQTTDDAVRGRRHDDLINPTDIIEDLFDTTHRPDKKSGR